MSSLFTAERRTEVLDSLKLFFKADDQIAGLVLVGSGAKETQDAYSGLDLLVVVKNGAVFLSTYRKWRERVLSLFPVAYHFEQDTGVDKATWTLMLDDFLEINLYFSRLMNLTAVRKPWCVLFDQTLSQDVEKALDVTFSSERNLAPTRYYKQTMTTIWQPILKCVAALNRHETWRAMYMLDQIRQQTIELAALNYNIETTNYAEVDQLPEMLLVMLRHTLPTGSSQIAIRRALRTTMVLFFQQAEMLEERIKVDLAADFKRRILPYIEAYAS
jgi:predicted nucleotidyltransferase